MPSSDALSQLLDSLTPDIYAALKRAVELGKWPNGQRLEPAQRELCLQAVIYYDCRHKPEQERVGFIDREAHDHCGSTGDAEHDRSQPGWNDSQLLVLRDLMAAQDLTRH